MSIAVRSINVAEVFAERLLTQILNQTAMSARRFCMALSSYMYRFGHFLLLRMLFKNIRFKLNKPRPNLYAGKLLGAEMINNQGRSNRNNHM